MLDIFTRSLNSGSVSYTIPDLTISFERISDACILTLDKQQRKRSCSIENSERKKFKITQDEKLDIVTGIEMMNSDSLKAKVVINRTIVKELSFMESMILSFTEYFQNKSF